jgi:acetyl-CoA acetyltransferase
MPTVGNDVVIVGIGETPVGALPGMRPVQIQATAVLAALKDAGLTLRDLDGVINLDPYLEPNSMFATTLAEYLGVRASFLSTVDVGGTVTSMTMVQQAVWAIQSGHCRIAAVAYGENNKTGRPSGVQGMMMQNLLGGEEWEEPFGMQGLVIPYALLAQRYLHQYDAAPEDFGAVAVTTRRHALRNDNAQMKKPITLDDYLASRAISSPLRLLDCSLVSDGGGAMILMSRDDARKIGVRGVGIKSFAMRSTHNTVAQLPDIEQLGMAAAGRDAFTAAGLGVDDIDLAQIHDAFTISVAIALEAFGFCGAGETGAYYRSGAADLGGKCPVNTHGGLLSQAHIGGMLHFTEAVRQLRGEAGARQVEGARHALVSGNGGIFSVCGAMILEGEGRR